MDVVDEPKRKEREPTSFTLANPDRLVPSQVPYISIAVEGQRYVPVDHRMLRPTGIVILMDTDPEAPKDENVAKGTHNLLSISPSLKCSLLNS
jgi:hypothetical protein